ncbi:MAG: hypothetical protein ACLUPK_06430 [Veillonella sp.]
MNTCSVTNMGECESCQLIRKAKRQDEGDAYDRYDWLLCSA